MERIWLAVSMKLRILFGQFKAQRAGERRALAHAAGELPGIVVGEIVKTDGFEGAPRPRVTLGARYALEEHAEIDVLGDRFQGNSAFSWNTKAMSRGIGPLTRFQTPRRALPWAGGDRP